MAFSKLEKAMAAIIGIQLAPGGAELTRKVVGKVLMGVASRAPAVAGGIAAIPGAPGAIGAGLGYAALQTELGQQYVGLGPGLSYDPTSVVAERGRQDRLRLERFVQDTLALAPMRRKKRMSGFNQAVKKGMSIVKASPSYGKKGVISSPKKAFGVVTKAVSKVNRALKAGKKKPKSGNVMIKKILSAAAKIIEKRGIKTYRKRYRLPKRKTKKDYRDYDPQG